MVQLILIGIGAGAATALLFASVASGSPLSVPLFYLAPLPILIAALGWSHWAALIAAIVASARPRRRVRRIVLRRLPDRRSACRRGGSAISRCWRGRRRGARRARMVSGRPSGVLGRDPRRRHRDRRDAELRQRSRQLPRLAAQRPRTHAARQPARHRAPDAAPACPTSNRLIDLLVAVLPPAAAVLATITNVDQSLARRTHRARLRPAAPPAVQICRRCASRAYAPALHGRRGRRPRSCPASSASRPACSPRAC